MIIVNDLIGHDLADIFNSNGHRCKELNKLNTKNYILFAGGNAGVDIDMPIEETYPYIISKNCRLDYYNLCVSSGGLDVLRYNLLVWYKKYPPPKALIINTEFLQSQLVSDPIFSFLKEGDPNTEEMQEIYKAGTGCYYFNAKEILTDILLSNTIQGLKYQIICKDDRALLSTRVVNIINDTDEFNHELIAESISQDLNVKLKKARP
jgi:hypothetical protein